MHHHCIEEPLSYRTEELVNWQKNLDDCINILINSKVPMTIKQSIGYRKEFIIDEKGCCLGRRLDSKGKQFKKKTIHFDVAKVAACNSKDVKAGWYGSYDWLKNPLWIDKEWSFASGEHLDEFKEIFHKAIIANIDYAVLIQLQEAAKKLPYVAEPDLWFIKNDGSFLFIEAKYGNRKLEDSQIAALALLNKILKAETKVIRIYQAGKNVKLYNYTDKFNHFYSLI